MEEIADNVFLEGGYPRVFLGVFKLDRGLFMIDAPFRHEDGQSWKAKLSRLGTDMDRLLLLLDGHIDRTLMAPVMETEIIIQENAQTILHNRSTSQKSRELEIAPDWTHAELPQGTRFFKPHITFSNEVLIHWGTVPLVVSHQSGAHFAGAWLIVDAKRVVFIGDSVVTDQPPFLAKADLPNWIGDLELLLSNRFANYKIVSSRNGLIQPRSVKKMLIFLTETKERVDGLLEEDLPLIGVPELSSQLLKKIDFDPQQQDQFHHRLTRGLEQYIKRHLLKKDTESKGENE